MNRVTGPERPVYDLRTATSTDEDFIYGLRVSGLKDFVDQIWGWDEAFQRERFEKSFNSAAYQIISVEGRDVGAMSVDWREGEVSLDDIEITKEWRGRGLGTQIITDLMAQASRQGCPVSLQVLKLNPAQDLYKRLGFRVVDETVTHYLMRNAVIAPERE
jgi:ribosomal protein S18 acetylase RimI-like enzyme